MTELERKQDRAPVPAGLGRTRPRPSRATSSQLARALRPLHRRRVGRAEARRYTTIDPGDRGAARRGRPGDARGGRRAPSRPRARRSRTAGRRSPGSERAKYLFRIARILQERSREFAVLESLNGGKPIKESRDVDLPLAAAHFFYYAGWADKLEYAFPNRRAAAARRRRPDHPVELPAADAGLEDRAGARRRATRSCSSRPRRRRSRRCSSATCCARPSCRRASSTSSPATAATGAALVEQPSVDKIAFTGSTEVGKAIQRELAGTGKKLTLELGGKAANIVFDDARARPGGRGDRQRHLLQPGPRLLRRLAAAACRSRSPRTSIDKLQAPRMTTLRVGDPLDKNTDVGAINSQAAAREDPGARRERARRRARRSTSRRARCPSRATGSRRPSSPTSRRATGSRRRRSSGRCCRVLTFRTPDEAVEKANNTPYGLSAGVWTEKGSRILWMAAAPARRRRLGEHLQHASTRPRPFGGYKESRLRPRGRPPRARAVPAVRGRRGVGRLT